MVDVVTQLASAQRATLQRITQVQRLVYRLRSTDRPSPGDFERAASDALDSIEAERRVLDNSRTIVQGVLNAVRRETRGGP